MYQKNGKIKLVGTVLLSSGEKRCKFLVTAVWKADGTGKWFLSKDNKEPDWPLESRKTKKCHLGVWEFGVTSCKTKISYLP